jgi:hypothetical protein
MSIRIPRGPIKGFGLVERRAIAVFKNKAVVHPDDLPVGIAAKTMASLVKCGLVQEIDGQRAWKLVH